ncbi:uncharacterized protein F4812DRAFT_71759 [Daldinia caldariorum]|uniref:uncharacterized protein n=1 Tax=Daldinia caldariorum TaxID=326644 RepID=UPI0020084EE2|nr:uncharacterized protein F4812DRAFT_71759 [Daldinia caldariorum]KAI1466957.1 hypothetical protein F4812DRAFT_71759 [Daldinia caldariorum]
MFEELLKACKSVEGSQNPSQEIDEDLLRLVPDNITIHDLESFLSHSKDESDHVALLIAAYAIILKFSKNAEVQGIINEDNFDGAVNEIADHISSLIVPLCSGDSLDQDETDYATLQRKGNLGLKALDALTKIPSKAIPFQLPRPVLLRIAAFTNPTDPWTTAESSALSQTLLSAHLDGSQARPFIVDDVLAGFLRPLFSKSRPAAITASGRKAEYVEEASRYDGAARESSETKPWKYAHRYAVTVFEWAVRHADSPLLQAHWPLFTPVLLTLIDEPGPAPLKIRALGILRAFWARCPQTLMRDTGLAEVFEQAVFPAVLYLPSLTPEDEALQILGAAYPVLIEMAGLTIDQHTATVGSASTAETQKPAHSQITEAQRRLLDKIIREGIMVGYHHAKDHVRLVGLFCETLVCIINGMGILAVKHLKDFLPMLSEIMTDPFGTKYPPALISSIKLLQAVLLTCWPRIPHYCNEIVKMLMLSWLNISDEAESSSFTSDSSPIANELKTGLIQTATMLSAIMNAANVNFGERVDPLVEKDPRLSELFCLSGRG